MTISPTLSRDIDRDESAVSGVKLTPTLAGRVALVTGGVRGIGLAIGQDFLERGATVAAGYSRNEEAAGAYLAEADPSRVSVHQGNISNHADCERVSAWDRPKGRGGRGGIRAAAPTDPRAPMRPRRR